MSNSLPQAPMKPVPMPQKSGNKWLPGCLIGCGIVFIIFAVVISVGSYFLYTRGPALVAEIARTSINEALEQVDELPEEERKLIQKQVDRVADAFKNGDITVEEFGNAVEKIAQSPVIGSVALLVLESQYIDESGLSDEEKEQASRTVQRIWRGVIEEKIDPDQLKPIFEIISDKTKESNNEYEWSFKETLTDEELRSFLDELKTLADEAEIPDEDFEFSIGEEIKQIVDDLLDGTAPGL